MVITVGFYQGLLNTKHFSKLAIKSHLLFILCPLIYIVVSLYFGIDFLSIHISKWFSYILLQLSSFVFYKRFLENNALVWYRSVIGFTVDFGDSSILEDFWILHSIRFIETPFYSQSLTYVIQGSFISIDNWSFKLQCEKLSSS